MSGGSANRASAISVARPARPYGPNSLVPGKSAVTKIASSAKVGIARPMLVMLMARKPPRPRWPEPQRDRQPDDEGDQQRGDREQQLLLHQVQHPAVAGPVGPGREVVPGVAEDGHARSPPGPGRQHPLREHDDDVEQDGEHHAEHRGGEQLGAEVGVDAVLDQVAEPAVRHQRADRRQRDGGHGRHPEPGHDHRDRQRELDPEQQPAGAVAEAAGRLDHLVRYAAQPLEHRPDQDGQRVERQRDHHRGLGQPGERHHQRQQRQRRDRVDGGADAEHARLQPRVPASQQGQRERDHDAQQHRERGDLEVLDGGVLDLGPEVLDVLTADPLVGEPAVAGRAVRAAGAEPATASRVTAWRLPIGEPDKP